jgi:protein SCO1/2
MVMPMPAPRQKPYVPPLHEGDAVPQAALVDQRGRQFDLRGDGGRTTVVSFIYTRCRDARMCPLVAAKFARMQRALRGTPIRLVTLTLDPAYDTAPVLARYGAAFGADPAIWSLVTGPAPVIDELVGRLGVSVERRGPGQLLHTQAVVILDARGRVAREIDGAEWLPDDVIGAARSVAALPDDPWRRARLWLSDRAGAVCGAARASSLTAGTALLMLAAFAIAFGLIIRRAFHTTTPPG